MIRIVILKLIYMKDRITINGIDLHIISMTLIINSFIVLLTVKIFLNRELNIHIIVLKILQKVILKIMFLDLHVQHKYFF